MAIIDDKSKHEFIASGATKCPYCGKDQLSGGAFQADGTRAFQELTCPGCGERCEAVYDLSDVNAC